MTALNAISLEARTLLFEVMLGVAWADREIQSDERAAAYGAAVSLGLVLPQDRDLRSFERGPVPLHELDPSSVSARDRELIFVCAAWMAYADQVETTSEMQLLGALRTWLGISDLTAIDLRRLAHEIRVEMDATHASFYRSFDALVVTAAKRLAATDR